MTGLPQDLSGNVMLGTAGWSIPSANAADFPGDGSHLERYAGQLRAVEINSSFYRPHRLATYQRWAAAVPPAFRFAVKLPKAITHARRLLDSDDLLASFAGEVAGLGDTLGVVLVQLPPSLAFGADLVDSFFLALRRHMDVAVACEPRHPSWFGDEADARLAAHRVARVVADPVLAPGGERPGGWPGLRYHRLHGAPIVYRSAYDEAALRELAGTLTAPGASAPWCIFDNTASGAAIADALALRGMLARA